MRPNPPIAAKRRGNRLAPAFTLVEMLVVIAIIGVLLAVGIPAFKGFGKSNAIAAADRQLLDDLAFARQRAIAERTTVYMVFLPPMNSAVLALYASPDSRQQVTNLLQRQYATYNFYVERAVGDQPGGPHRTNYLTSWKSLPEGIFIATKKFVENTVSFGVLSFESRNFPFPTATNASLKMPYLAFNHLGQLVNPRQSGAEFLPLARGSIFVNADLSADVLENPPGNSAATSSMRHYIRIEGITGRASVEQQEIQ